MEKNDAFSRTNPVSPTGGGILLALGGQLIVWLIDGWIWFLPVTFGITALFYMLAKRNESRISWQDSAKVYGFAAVISGVFAILMLMQSTQKVSPNPPERQTPKSAPAPADQVRPTKTAEADRSPPTPAVATTPTELIELYGENQVAAARRFGTGTLLVTGRVIRVREALGTGIIVFDTGYEDHTLEASFVDAATRQLEAIRAGENVTATCPGATELMGEVILGGCTAVSKKLR